jgi:asparagine synthase (glutamine-hydrolysing)
MCGISGILIKKSSKYFVNDKILTKMINSISHRGPDGRGFWISNDNKIGFAHARLAVIDLSSNASQPMSTPDNSFRITFNGEIYNHQELRAELKSIGINDWTTDHSDTETLLFAFREWGIKCLEKIRGMFSFAIWDTKENKLWLIRDRLGIKPLYYAIDNNQVKFSSEIKSFFCDPSQKKILNNAALFHYLSFLTAPAPLTFFEGIYKVPSGCWVSFDDKLSMEEGRYWDPLESKKHIDTKYDTYKNILNKEILNAISLHNNADVPIGIFLSGGIDSSILASLSSKNNPKINAFTASYDKKYNHIENESIYARKTCELYKVNFFNKVLTEEDLLNFLPEMIKHQDEPIGDPVCLPIFYLADLARQKNVKVVLVGEGADELFCGYESWRRAIYLEKIGAVSLLLPFKKLLLGILNLLKMNHKFYVEYLKRNIDGKPIFWGGAEAFTEDHKREILSDDLRSKFKNISSWDILKPIRKNFLLKRKKKNYLDWMTYLDLNIRLPELLLMRVDKMTMSSGIEARVPFLDHKVVEFAFQIPEKFKIKNNRLKFILKDALSRYIPAFILKRPKVGFSVPILDWFSSDIGNKAKNELDFFCNETNILNLEEVNKLFVKKKFHQIWYLYNFALWWRYNFYEDESKDFKI